MLALVLPPAVIVGDNGHRCIRQTELFGEHNLRTRGHVDGVRAPLLKHLGLGARAKTRPFNGDHGARRVVTQAQARTLPDELLTQLGAEGRIHRHVTYAVEVVGMRAVVVGLLALGRAVNEVVEDCEVAGLVGLVERAAGGGGEHHMAAGVAQSEQVGAVVDLGGPGAVRLVVAVEENAVDVVELAADEW